MWSLCFVLFENEVFIGFISWPLTMSLPRQKCANITFMFPVKLGFQIGNDFENRGTSSAVRSGQCVQACTIMQLATS